MMQLNKYFSLSPKPFGGHEFTGGHLRSFVHQFRRAHVMPFDNRQSSKSIS
jgi:hypothetical protein